jgi:hypothetical protein
MLESGYGFIHKGFLLTFILGIKKLIGRGFFHSALSYLSCVPLITDIFVRRAYVILRLVLFDFIGFN